MNRFTLVADWIIKLIGMDDAHHHGLSFTKLIILLFSLAVVVHVLLTPAITWPLVLLIVGLVCAAFGRPLMQKFLDLLAAKWSAQSIDSTSVAITGDAAQLVRDRKALPNLWTDDESGDPRA